ncbi:MULTISPECIES: hypothetical protein [unclassified Nocardia]|uniref:hypothetical protein n=1 Tax=unclassified Nocardia TaxID=2637762 RepID=UPI001CE40F01|nr:MULTISPECIES: hypothetical protein [unclassified Nocardia]
MVEVKVVDETTTGNRDYAWTFEVAEERLPLREVIRRRVYEEVAEYNAAAAGGVFRGLVRPAHADVVGDGFRITTDIDPERQYDAVLKAFARNGLVVLVGDRQIEELDEMVALPTGVEITFLRLIALVGG